MTHRKVCSQGNIPFSWEDSPGVSKAIHNDHCPKDKGLHVLNQSSPSPKKAISAHQQYTKIPLPPCQNLQAPRRSTSAKGFNGWWQEDPFLAAYKECTKNVRNGNGNSGKLHSEKKNKHSDSNVITNGCKLGIRKNKLMIFSCKNSCDVKDDNLVRLSNLPPIPSDRNRSKCSM